MFSELRECPGLGTTYLIHNLAQSGPLASLTVPNTGPEASGHSNSSRAHFPELPLLQPSQHPATCPVPRLITGRRAHAGSCSGDLRASYCQICAQPSVFASARRLLWIQGNQDPGAVHRARAFPALEKRFHFLSVLSVVSASSCLAGSAGARHRGFCGMKPGNTDRCGWWASSPQLSFSSVN